VAIGLMLALMFATMVPLVALAETYVVSPGEKNTVTFVSKAPMETFEGVTDQISGTIEFNRAAVSTGVTVTLSVDLASIDTGIGKRNTHMRERHLETDKFPVATFISTSVVDPEALDLSVGKAVNYLVVGEFDLHGVKREQEVEVTVTLLESGDIHVIATFPVDLADHEISRPKFLFLKLNEVQVVTVDFVAHPKPSPPPDGTN